MLKNTTINLGVIRKIALALGPMNEQVIQEAIHANLFYDTRTERYQRIIESIKQILK